MYLHPVGKAEKKRVDRTVATTNVDYVLNTGSSYLPYFRVRSNSYTCYGINILFWCKGLRRRFGWPPVAGSRIFTILTVVWQRMKVKLMPRAEVAEMCDDLIMVKGASARRCWS